MIVPALVLDHVRLEQDALAGQRHRQLPQAPADHIGQIHVVTRPRRAAGRRTWRAAGRNPPAFQGRRAAARGAGGDERPPPRRPGTRGGSDRTAGLKPCPTWRSGSAIRGGRRHSWSAAPASAYRASAVAARLPRYPVARQVSVSAASISARRRGQKFCRRCATSPRAVRGETASTERHRPARGRCGTTTATGPIVRRGSGPTGTPMDLLHGLLIAAVLQRQQRNRRRRDIREQFLAEHVGVAVVPAAVPADAIEQQAFALGDPRRR